MKKKKKIIIWSIVVFVVVAAIVVLVAGKSGKDKSIKAATVKVEKRNIVDKALAVGTIDPETEIAIKSKISGVVKKLFVDAGSLVKEGDPLIEIKPDPTPLELAEAKRYLEISNISLENATNDYNRLKQLKEKGLISEKEFDGTKQNYEQEKIRLEMSKERLALLEKGKITIANATIEGIIKAPTSGYILMKKINVGDPIVPLTSYQAGTEIFTMADMNQIRFKGTVDEIDVGKLKEGMEAEIQVGALPGKPVTGKVIKISLKAQKIDNSTVFPIEISINKSEDLVLRAGYSANANIIIQKKDSVLAIPERVVTFRKDSAFVNISQPNQGKKELYIKTGLSDAIYIEVIEGLKEGDEILEKEVKVIT